MIPAAGVECRRCRDEKQHRCQAQMFAEGVPLCLPCADDEPCVVERVPAAPSAEFEEAGILDADIPVAPVVRRTPEDLGLSRVVVAAAPERQREQLDAARREAARRAGMRAAQKLHAAVEQRRKRLARTGRLSVRAVGERLDVRVIGGEAVRVSPGSVMAAEAIATEIAGGKEEAMPTPGKLTEQQKQEIRNADPAVANSALARKYGVTLNSIWYQRNVATKRAVKGKPGPKPAKKPAALIRRGQEPIIVDAAAKGSIDGLMDGLNGDGIVRVKFELALPREQVLERLRALSDAQLATAIGAVLTSALRGA